MHRRNALIALIMTACLMTMPIAMADSSEDIPTNATNTGVHDTLVDALVQADLVSTLQGDGPFTVFAPTDQAFADAGINLSTFDTDEEIAVLTDILLYHVYTAGAVYAADVTDGLTVAMANGDDASFTVTDGTVMIGDATVTTADVMASNGVIHVIDKVLMPPADLVDIAAVAMSTGMHDSLVAALVKADLVSTVQGDGPFTVFAPTDQAFTNAGIDLDSFTTDEEIAALTNILLYHVYSGAVNAANVTDGLAVQMVNGDYAQFTVTEGTVMIEDATVTAADVMASNGVIHVIDKVLMPPAPYTGVGICYNSATHMIAAGASMEECGAYMYVENYSMNGQEFTGCYNTVSHSLTDTTQAICESYMWTPPVDIATTAMSTGIHTSLVAALSASELVATLQGDGPFTVFAPTDQAFADAGIDLAAFTTDEDIATLTDILLYHVYSGAVNAADVTDGLTVAMVNGDDASFTVTDGTVMVGDATVVLADVPASNGVIHVIDKVLMPPADEPVVPEGCDFVIGLTDDGMAFDNTDLSIAVGETVCWIWNDAAMAHNVAQIREEGDTTRDVAGEYSGAAATNVDYRITFDEDETFYYICEPHAGMGMDGKVVVGTGISETSTTVVDSDDNTPGFTAGIAAIALISALVVAGSRRR
uniref:Secreted and surface protein containing fasciclin-like repeats and a Cu ion binding domain n=1 Tax=uncultured Poseidoniia archaeon TaxID=1697135 RepID=A0A1B1T9Y6_9ARCH|nr:secreted and surface protein containing fasciclin-like repeats and a Cu ion binding domain [uncultured Candidatus Thalassoarchaea sp.]